MVTCYGITPNTHKGDWIIKEVVRLLLGGIEGGGADYETAKTEITDPYCLLVGQNDSLQSLSLEEGWWQLLSTGDFTLIGYNVDQKNSKNHWIMNPMHFLADIRYCVR